MSHHQENGSIGSMLIGFVFAISNHMFGWFNSFLQVEGTHLNDWLQAFITGSIGAIGAFFMNKLLKTIDTRMISYFTDLEHFNKKKVLEKVGKLNVFRSYKFEYMSIKNISDLIDNLYDQSILLHETWMVVAKEKEEKKMQAMIDASEEQELKVRLDALRCS